MRGRYLAVVVVAAGTSTQCGGRALSGEEDPEPTPVEPVGRAGSNPRPSPAGGAAAQGGFAGSRGVIPGSGGRNMVPGAGGAVVGMAGGNNGAGGSFVDAPDIFPTVVGVKNVYGFAFKDSYYLAPCTEVQSYACLLLQGACPNQDAAVFEQKGYISEEEFKLGGELGKFYDVTIRVNGIVEGKYYRNGKRRRGEDFDNAHDPAGSDGFYIGGEPVPSIYGVYKLTVLQPDGTTEVEHYYLNSFPPQSGFESHQTFPLGYEAVIRVPGHGFIRRLYQDSDCRAQNNCGPDDASMCPSPRNVPNEPGLEVPAMYGGVSTASLNVVNGATQPWHAQMVHITVTDVKQAQ